MGTSKSALLGGGWALLISGVVHLLKVHQLIGDVRAGMRFARKVCGVVAALRDAGWFLREVCARFARS